MPESSARFGRQPYSLIDYVRTVSKLGGKRGPNPRKKVS
jgi:hypothetical protein